MELIHTVLDLVLPPALTIVLIVTWPLIAIVKIIDWAVHMFKKEQLRGKVVVITGASSGIGEHLAYQYAKRGAKLVLSARREGLLNEVAERAKSLGAAETFVVTADVTQQEECHSLIDAAVNRFGGLDHLVLNAGVANSFLFEEAQDTKGWPVVIDSLFWGCVHPTHYALPYLRRSKGRIVVIGSVASWLPYPRQTLYNAGKAATFQFFETLRVEVGSAVGITIATPGWVESELTRGKFIADDADASLKQNQRDEHVGPAPVLSVTECAKSIVSGAERRKRYVAAPFWYYAFLPYRILTPEILDWNYRMLFLPRDGKPPLSKTIIDKTRDTGLYTESMEQKAK